MPKRRIADIAFFLSIFAIKPKDQLRFSI